jgi:hypothetical protein
MDLHRKHDEKCFLCGTVNASVQVRGLSWHYRPRAKYRYRQGARDEWTILRVLLCEGCKKGVNQYVILSHAEKESTPKESDIESFARKRGVYLVGWDWWDAIDGLELEK